MAASGEELSFARVPSGAVPAGAAAVDAALSEAAAVAAVGASSSQAADTTAAAAGAAPAMTDGPKPASGGVQGMKARALKFDPLKAVSAAAQAGADVSQDGWGARADPETLDANAN